MAEKTLGNFDGQVVIAMILIALLAGSIFAVFYTVYNQNSNLKDELTAAMASRNFTDQSKIIMSQYDDSGKNNLNIFNLIIPSLTTALGSVVAYYFGSKNLQNAQDAHTQQIVAITSSSKLSDAIGTLLKKYPNALDVMISSMNDNLGKVLKDTGSFGNTVIIDDNNTPIGILYRNDLLESKTTPNSGWDDNKQLKIFITNITDSLTKQNWTQSGINNFAKLSLDDTFASAKSALDKIKPDNSDVRGLVLSGTKIVFIVNSNMLSNPN